MSEIKEEIETLEKRHIMVVQTIQNVIVNYGEIMVEVTSIPGITQSMKDMAAIAKCRSDRESEEWIKAVGDFAMLRLLLNKG